MGTAPRRGLVERLFRPAALALTRPVPHHDEEIGLVEQHSAARTVGVRGTGAIPIHLELEELRLALGPRQQTSKALERVRLQCMRGSDVVLEFSLRKRHRAAQFVPLPQRFIGEESIHALGERRHRPQCRFASSEELGMCGAELLNLLPDQRQDRP
jgi:hypothetical protein